MKPIKEEVFALCVVLGVLLFFTALQALETPQSKNEGQSPKKCLVIAHRGASGYLPEHTLEAKAMAYAMGADYIEQDVVLTKDNRAVVLYDIHLDEVTDVARLFPGSKRGDGRYYAIDLTLAEIKTLTATERFKRETGEAYYPNRFPVDTGIDFKLHTLEEEIKFIQGLNKSTGKNVGIYVELKKPRFHQKKGKDIAAVVLDILGKYGYKDKNSNCYLQCFNKDCLREMRDKFKSNLKMVQLIDNEKDFEDGIEVSDFQKLLTEEGLKEIKEYADGIGPYKGFWEIKSSFKKNYKEFVETAHKHGLEVHPWTFRADDLPAYAHNSYEELVRVFIEDFGVDGIFTDFPDKAAEFLNNKKQPEKRFNEPGKKGD